MSRIEDLRKQYQAAMAGAPEAMAMFYTGLLMGVDLAAGAAAEDRVVELKEAAATSTNGSWRREATPSGTRTPRDPNKEVDVYALVDPRSGKAFYVGSSIDPEKQLQDYIRSEDVSISCKPLIEEIIGEGSRPTIQVLETGVKMAMASARKEAHMALLTEAGAELVNQRR